MIVSEQNFLIYAASHYTNKSCTSTDEFLKDLERIKYIKKLFYTYRTKGVLRERLILNHLVVLYNVFEPRACTRMLFFRLEEYLECLKPFLSLLNYLPILVDGIGSKSITYKVSDIKDDALIVNKLREISRG